ncbi:MAG: hypothetical protein AAF492_06440 [Verrucomicrobiota bacterium]
MNDLDQAQLNTKLIKTMMHIEEKDGPQWPETDLAELWQHQLTAPLKSELNGVSPETETVVASLPDDAMTFGDLFQHPEPPIEWLRLVKDFAKIRGTEDEEMIPRDICSALYYTSIRIAETHEYQDFSSLDRNHLAEGIDWLCQQTWLDDRTRAILTH